MARKSLTSEEVELLIRLRNACSGALRHGLGDAAARAELDGLAARVPHMIGKIELSA